jgi:hypothetical protein
MQAGAPECAPMLSLEGRWIRSSSSLVADAAMLNHNVQKLIYRLYVWYRRGRLFG